MYELNILDQIETAKGKDKERILLENKDNQNLKELLDAALNFKKKFFIKKFNDQSLSKAPYLNDHAIFMVMLSQLETRKLTGSSAIRVVELFLSKCNQQQAKWYSRVIRKDLRAGVDISTVNKAGFNIPEFEVQLAKDGKLCKTVDSILRNGAYVSPKLDGYRCLAIIEDGEVTLYSRNGTVYENFPTIKEALLKAFHNAEHNPKYVLDGEIMSNNFTSMQQSAFASKRGTTVGDVVYNIFDLISHNEWSTDNFVTKASKRYSDLEILFAMKDNTIDNLQIVEHTLVKTLEEVLQKEQDFIAMGYEGVMLNPDIAYYKGKKTNKMLKFKTMKSMDCKVVDFIEGKGKYVGTLGAMVVIQENGKKCEVGSGFTDDDRDYIWSNKESTLNRIVECKYQELTDDGIMRFPIKKQWRNDK